MSAEWVGTATTAVGAIGAAIGAAGGLTVFFQRKKFRADAADVITDTALTLLEPLKNQVIYLEASLATTKTQLGEVSDALSDITSMMRRWRRAILGPATREELREMVTADNRSD